MTDHTRVTNDFVVLYAKASEIRINSFSFNIKEFSVFTNNHFLYFQILLFLFSVLHFIFSFSITTSKQISFHEFSSQFTLTNHTDLKKL